MAVRQKGITRLRFYRQQIEANFMAWSSDIGCAPERNCVSGLGISGVHPGESADGPPAEDAAQPAQHTTTLTRQHCSCPIQSL